MGLVSALVRAIMRSVNDTFFLLCLYVAQHAFDWLQKGDHYLITNNKRSNIINLKSENNQLSQHNRPQNGQILTKNNSQENHRQASVEITASRRRKKN